LDHEELLWQLEQLTADLRRHESPVRIVTPSEALDGGGRGSLTEPGRGLSTEPV